MPEKPTELKRTITLPLLTFYGLGTVIGAGVYVLIGEVAGSAGAFAPLAFLMAALVAALSALAFAEFAARKPRSGGEVAYVQHAFGSGRLSVLVGLVVMLTGIVSAATLADGFAGYFREFWAVPHNGAVAGVLAAMTLLAIWGISQSVWTATLITLLEVGGLVFVLALLGTDMPAQGFAAVRWWPDSLAAWSGVAVAAFIAFYAFIGFEDMVNVAEEVKEPEKAMPWAIAMVMVSVTVIYLAISVMALAHVSPEALAGSDAPMTYLLREQGGWATTLITAVSLVAVINGALVQVIMASRVLYGMANQGLIWSGFSKVAERTRTPVRSTVAVGVVVLILAVSLPLSTLAQITSFLILLVFITVNIGLFVVKRREPAEGFAVPQWWPLAATAACVGMLLIRLYMLVSG